MQAVNECNKIYPDCEGPDIIMGGKYKSIFKMKCKDFYWSLIDRMKVQPSCIKKWTEIFPKFKDSDPEIWNTIFRMSYNATHETVIQSFQYRIIHRIIPCNKWLNTITVKETNICNYCDEVDDMFHFLLYCNKVHEFWVSFYKWWNRITNVRIIDETEIDECILFGYPGDIDIVHVLNFAILQAKYYIYIQRLCANNKIDFYNFLVLLKSKLKMKKYMYEKNNNARSFEMYKVLYDAL